jgi:hypothetical protein
MVPIENSYLARVRRKYNESGDIWDRRDRWHDWTRRQIEAEMINVSKAFSVESSEKSLVVDVGSAGHAYFRPSCPRVDVDIAEARLTHCALALCASLEALPLRPAISSLTICVGPVVNYCSLEEGISELARITKAAAQLVLHVELSNSWEFFGTKAYRDDAAFVTTFYKGKEQYWVYSDSYVRRTLELYGFAITRVRYFHLLSGLVYRLSRRANLASIFARVDRFFAGPLRLGSMADSAIYVCRRQHRQ